MFVSNKANKNQTLIDERVQDEAKWWCRGRRRRPVGILLLSFPLFCIKNCHIISRRKRRVLFSDVGSAEHIHTFCLLRNHFAEVSPVFAQAAMASVERIFMFMLYLLGTNRHFIRLIQLSCVCFY